MQVIGDYLRDRWIEYPGRYGAVCRREVRCGVSQGSGLGPLLWDLAYDWILRGALLPGLGVVCYVDDTLLLVRKRNYWIRARVRANVGVTHLVRRIRMALTVALHKTKTIGFAEPRIRGPPRGTQFLVEGV